MLVRASIRRHRTVPQIGDIKMQRLRHTTENPHHQIRKSPQCQRFHTWSQGRQVRHYFRPANTNDPLCVLHVSELSSGRRPEERNPIKHQQHKRHSRLLESMRKGEQSCDSCCSKRTNYDPLIALKVVLASAPPRARVRTCFLGSGSVRFG